MKIDKADVEATGKPRYTRWSQVPEGLRTKTQWSQEGMRLREEAEPAGYVWSSLRKSHYPLYTSDSVEPKQKRSPGKAHPLTPENIGAALFEINKAAKRRRDAASAAYQNGNHGVAGTQRVEKTRLYDLKDRVLSKAVSDEIAHFVGYHVKHDNISRRVWNNSGDEGTFDGLPEDELGGDGEFGQQDDDRKSSGDGGCRVTVVEQRETAMACYELGGFRFHTILSDLPTHAETQIKDLGTWVSAATARTRHMTLKDAEATLAAYLRS